MIDSLVWRKDFPGVSLHLRGFVPAARYVFFCYLVFVLTRAGDGEIFDVSLRLQSGD